MPRPKNHDDQPRCDECGMYGEWYEDVEQYLCENCAEYRKWEDDNEDAE